MKTTVLSYVIIILLSSVNACVDKNPSCATWAAIGECSANPCYMLPNCPVSCKDCHGQVSLGSGVCVNTQSECPCWASQGRCGEEKVRSVCKKSCDKKCGGGGPDPNVCADISRNCAVWAAGGQCKKTPAYMNQFCKATCKKCPDTCVDKNPSCGTWAAIGECSANPCYMLPNCPVSCKDCQGRVSLGSGVCVNTQSECPCWASQGRCVEEKVRSVCKKSCDKKCGGGGPDPNVCADISLHCAVWAAAGQCQITPIYMNQFCKATCKKCPAKPKCNNRLACPTVYEPVCGTDGQTYGEP